MAVRLLALFFICVSFAVRAEAPITDIPKLEHIVIDGKADDWGERGFRVDLMTDRKGQARPADDFDPRFRLGWNDEGLLVLLTVRDNVPLEASAGDLWSRDGAEIFIAAARKSRMYYQVAIAPGVDPARAELRKLLLDKRDSHAVALSCEAARTKTTDGYICEVLLPWKNIGVEPKAGYIAAFQLYVNDFDGEQTGKYQVVWHPYNEAHHDPNAMEKIRLAEKPSPPVTTIASLVEDHGNLEIMVIGEKQLAGKHVTVTLPGDEKVVAQGDLKKEGGRAIFRQEMGTGKLQDYVAHIGSETIPLIKRNTHVHYQGY